MATVFDRMKQNTATKSTKKSKSEKISDSLYNDRSNGTAETAKVCPLALQFDDIVYEIITAASAMTKTDRERRESLSLYALVCQTWGRAAQSILFRQVFLQIRPSMMSLLIIINHDTDRGRRLARYIKSASIKLSREMEHKDPPSLPMIHPRHLPALLCHMPSLVDLDLTVGGAGISVNILKAIARGPKIRSLTLDVRRGVGVSPISQILRKENNPWPHLVSLTIKLSGHPSVDELTLDSRPNLNLVQLTIEDPPQALPDLCRWLVNGRSGLTHASIVSRVRYMPMYDGYLDASILKNVQSLTLGRVTWDEHLFEALHSLNRLKELRFSSGTILEREFPGHLPDTIEHLSITVPHFISTEIEARRGRGYCATLLTTGRPALLRTCDFINIDTNSEPWAIYGSAVWSKSYGQLAQDDGVTVTYADSQKKSTTELWLRSPFSSAELTDYKVPLYIQPTLEEFHPSGSQLDILDFEDILGRITGNQTKDQDRVTGRPETASDKKFFADLRKTIVSWTPWLKSTDRENSRTMTPSGSNS